MAHPKRRQGKTRTAKRRTHDKAVAPTMAICPNCGAWHIYHTVCGECGYYRGKLANCKKKLLCKFVNLYGLMNKRNSPKSFLGFFLIGISSPFIFKDMDKINAVITGVGGYVPEDVLTNEDISKMVDTTDEWIMTRVGIKERRILKGEGVGLSYMGIRAVKQLLEKTNLNPEEVEVILTATTTPDHHFPTTSSIIAYHTGCKNAMTFDMQGACAGFLYALETGANYIRSGRYKKVVVVSGDKMTSITDYQDRSTCPLFGDACGAVLLEPTTEEFGVLDTILRTDGVGYPHLIMKSGGSAYPPSHETVDNREHFVYQDGRVVFKYAVSYMADVAAEIAEKNGLTHDDIAWIVPHQANLRIIDATAKRLGVDMDKVMINIQKYGNTSAGTIPICLWEWENQLKKGDNLILAAFGAGFTWGAVYLKWGYDGKKA